MSKFVMIEHNMLVTLGCVATIANCPRKNINPDRRLIEDFIPIREISAQAAREKSIRKGHISTLHLW